MFPQTATLARPNWFRQFVVIMAAVLGLATVAAVVPSPVNHVKPAHAVTITVGQASGFTLHASVDWTATTHLGWTIHPATVQAIAHAIDKYKPATAAVLALVGAGACISFVGWPGALCGALFAAFGQYIIDVFDAAAAYGVCVTVKMKVALFATIPQWDNFPYVDSGSWCNYKKYIQPPPAPHYNGPLNPPCMPYPACVNI